MKFTRMLYRIISSVMAVCLVVIGLSPAFIAFADSSPNVYTRLDETYHEMMGFETDDVATINAGTASTDVKNNGLRSQKITVGDNTFLSTSVTLNESHPLSEANYVQFWINNTASTDQYLLNMSFKKNNVFQYNVPIGKDAILIQDGTSTETTVTWGSTRINGAGTMRSLLIPAGFCGYVRISVDLDDLTVQAPSGGTVNADTFDTTQIFGFYLGNTATGGDVYIDDLGYIKSAYPTSNTIYTKSLEDYNAITGFEKSETVTVSSGSSDSEYKNNGYSSHKWVVGDNTFVQANLSLEQQYPFSDADYLQFWIKNNADNDQYLLNMSFKKTGSFQYNVPTGVEAILIADNTTAEQTSVWSNVKINGAGTMRGLVIPVGFSGYVRISLAEENLQPMSGTFDADAFDTVDDIGFYLGNTATGGDVYIDDMGYITTREIESVTNTIYTEDAEKFYVISGFETDDMAEIGAGESSFEIKNNGMYSHCYTVGDDTFITSNVTLSKAYPLSNAKYIQFWVNNDTGADQYLFNMSFKGDGFQYNVPTGAKVTLIADTTLEVTTAECFSQKITGAGTVRAITIPADFSGYVRVPVDVESLQVYAPSGSSFDADKFDLTNEIGFNFANTSTGGNIYIDDLGYIVKNDASVYLETGESYHEITGFDDKTGGGPVNVDNGYSTAVKNSGTRSFMYTVPSANYVKVDGQYLETPNVSFEADAGLKNAKYVQLWLNNTSEDAVYLFNFSIQKPGSFQYRVKAGADVQLIDENQQTVVNAARWAYVTIGDFQKSRAIKIPAGFTGYVRLPVSAEDMQVVVPSGSSFDTENLANANLITYYIGSQSSGGKVYIDDVGYITGGNNAKAGAAFADLSSKKVFVDDATGVSMAYRLYLPENYDSNTKYPVVLYLHGNGFQGDDNEKHVIGEIGEPLDELVSLGNRSDYPCIIVAPQCPTGDFWVNTTFKNGSYSVDGIAETNAMKTVVNLLNTITEEYSVDNNRVYAAGVSMGAFGCWDIMIRHRGLLAAAIPMMGAGDPSKAIYVGNTAVWAFHCANDNTVPVSGSKDMVEALQQIESSNVKYTEYSGVGHSAYRFAIAEEELLPWLFAQVRDLENMPDLPKPPPPPEPATNEIYLQDGDTYCEISGFEADDTATMENSVIDANIKNNGYQSQKVTVGDDTFNSIAIKPNGSYKLSESAYIQFWINNASSSDQYLLGMNFQGNDFQYNVPEGVTSWLIADGSTDAQPVEWTNIQIKGANTIRSLLIPAGFSGYVRISTQPKDLEIKVPAGSAFDKDKFDTTTRIGLNIGNAYLGGDVYFDDLGYITNPNIEEEKPIEPANNPVYLENGDTYHEITGFEADDTVTANKGTVDVNIKNNGYQSHCFTVGDDTFITSNVILDTEYAFSSAKYLQFWIKNDTGADQYLFNMSFKGSGFQYNVPVGAEAILINGGQNITTSTWEKVKVKGADTVRALLIPAGFSGYVRVEITRNGLEVSVPADTMFDGDTLDKTNQIGFNLANTSTGGNVYVDDLGYITNPKYQQDLVKPVTNEIYLQDGDTYHEITGFEADDAVISSKGEPSTAVRNNGYQSGKYTIGDNTYTQAIFKFKTTYELSKSPYVQFWINNAAGSDQYLLSMSFQGDGFQYNVPTGAPVLLISDDGFKITESVWENTKIEGAGTMRGLLIPAGFSGYVRISLRPEHLAPKVGTYNASTFNKSTRISIYMGNTSTGGDIFLDDLGYITNPNYVGLTDGEGQASSNSIYLIEGDQYYKITGFEADDRVASNNGVPSTNVKNNGSQSHKYTVGDNKYTQAKLTLNDNYPFSTATSLQFWIKNDTGSDQYLMSMSFQGDGFQYNIPVGAECQFIDSATRTVVTKTWENIRVADAGTTRAVIIPAGFSGYVRVPVTMYDLKSLIGRYDAAKIDAAKIISLYFGNNSTGGDIYLDDLGYIINPDAAVEAIKPEGEPAKNDIFLNEGDKYHIITGFEADDTDATNPFDRKSHMVNTVKNNGHFGYQFCLPEADFVNASITFDNIPEIADSEYLQFWFSNPTDNNVYMFNLSFSDGSTFQYNITEETNIYLMQSGESEPTLAVWSTPKLGTYKGRSFVIPMGFSGYIRIPIDEEALLIKKPVDGSYDANTFAKTTKISFYLGNITTERNVYMDDVMFIDGEIMKDVIPNYDIDYSMDMRISLYGRLVDKDGNPMINKTLLLDNNLTTKTDSEGEFVFTGVSMDCHTLAIVEGDKIVAQTAITIMPGDETYLRGNYISKRREATSIVVNMQANCASIKLLDVIEGELTVDVAADSAVKNDEVNDDSNWSNIIIWCAVVIGAIIVIIVAVLLFKKFFKKA